MRRRLGAIARDAIARRTLRRDATRRATTTRDDERDVARDDRFAEAAIRFEFGTRSDRDAIARDAIRRTRRTTTRRGLTNRRRANGAALSREARARATRAMAATRDDAGRRRDARKRRNGERDDARARAEARGSRGRGIRDDDDDDSTAQRSGAATREETIAVPSMGDSISEGAVASVMKAVGDEVATDETVAQIETDKVTIDVRAPSAGDGDARGREGGGYGERRADR